MEFPHVMVSRGVLKTQCKPKGSGEIQGNLMRMSFCDNTGFKHARSRRGAKITTFREPGPLEETSRLTPVDKHGKNF